MKRSIQKKEYAVRLAQTDKDIADVKNLNDLVFDGKRGATLEELHKIKRHGFILILYNTKTKKIVGEAQFLLSSIPEIPYKFNSSIGYCHSLSIHPDFQARGFGKILMEKGWSIVISGGVKELHLSIRLENYPSLKLMFGQGFQIIGCRKSFLSPNKTKSSRLILAKKRTSLIKQHAPTKFVKIIFNGSSANKSYNKIEDLVSQGFRGISVNKDGIEFGLCVKDQKILLHNMF